MVTDRLHIPLYSGDHCIYSFIFTVSAEAFQNIYENIIYIDNSLNIELNNLNIVGTFFNFKINGRLHNICNICNGH